jgi:hypothetical protein
MALLHKIIFLSLFAAYIGQNKLVPITEFFWKQSEATTARMLKKKCL